MSRLKKLLDKITKNPKQIRFAQLDKILIRTGFQRRQPRKGSSHFTYTKGMKRITVPYNQPYIGEAYVKLVIKILEGEMNDD